MNCLEAQSKIITYIENGLQDQELKSFILHVKSCKECMDELELHYILIVGTKQMDEGGNITSDFLKELHEKFNSQLKMVKKKELFFKKLSFSISFFFLIIVVWQLFDLIHIMIPILHLENEITQEQKNDFLIERIDPYIYYSSEHTLIDPSAFVNNKNNK